ncbi:MAG: hypothetical protein O2819_09110 [Planctomycetota bacterium]|nr:hypothetical protein [Planctomycetota bacterium]MDA1105708.1 hypothetical protein [Planctomycetota bacterium]
MPHPARLQTLDPAVPATRPVAPACVLRSVSLSLSLSLLVSLLGGMGAGPSSAAEQGTTGQGASVIDTGDLIPVTPGEDGDPLRIQLFDPRINLRVDDSFAGTYSVRGTDLYARRASGLYAVYQRGEYVRYAGRDIAVVPAGTVYAIGSPDISLNYGSPWLPMASRPARAINPARSVTGASVHSRLAPASATEADHRDGPSSRGPRIAVDSAYRAECLRDLLAARQP